MTEHTALPDREGLVEIEGRPFYVMPDIETMDPFLMSVVSDGDRWMFVSSTGALTAGRVDATGALFPYETDDRLHAAAGRVGPVTVIRTRSVAASWRPFVDVGPPGIERRLAKAVHGDSVVFEETHPGLGLTFTYRWTTSEQHGFARTATLTNDGDETMVIELIDGLIGLLPYGLDPTVYQRLSNLSHAYKRAELIDETTRLATYSLEAPVSDSADAHEVLRATAVWSSGLAEAGVVLDPSAVAGFEIRRQPSKAALVTGRPGAYLLTAPVELAPGESCEWQIVADVGLDQFEVAALRRRLASRPDLADQVNAAGRANGEALERILAGADASQCTNAPVTCAHHVANVTYNVMRGGIPLSGYRIETIDFAKFIEQRNRVVNARHGAWMRSLPSSIDRPALLQQAFEQDDPHLTRLAREYLPFSFSRRHGDPSRPWNTFSIHLHDDDGQPLRHYEGNWRDVFQNWEALCASYPQYLPGVISVFLDASTADGHNPYRITRAGIDWEVPDPDDPWANIGYWGDHQLIYLLRLLEAADRYLPDDVAGLLRDRCFTYADVPYRLATFEGMVAEPKETITFDTGAHDLALARAESLGADGRLLLDAEGQPLLVSMLEKLIVAALAKLANFVPGGGIWMNTQRPEWNDANNALVGYGLSMVTLHHLRQFVAYLRSLVGRLPLAADRSVSVEVAAWLGRTHRVLQASAVIDAADDEDAPVRRLELLRQLGTAASDYRADLYGQGFSGATETVEPDMLIAFCDRVLEHLDATIEASRRAGGLVESYNLIEFSSDGAGATVRHLPEMLEGQVAALGSGMLAPPAQADLIETLFTSRLYREDQQSFLLAPARQLPSFLDKNVIPADAVETNPLLSAILERGETSIVRVDVDGRHRFHPDLVDEPALAEALDRLAADPHWTDLVRLHRQSVLDAYERVFGHRAFMGRSTAMYAYEGIGSIYWHMVGKLLVACQEAAFAAADAGAADDVVQRLVLGYDRIRAGLGFNKRAVDFGAVPTDPYSHTPSNAGAQQPGMTGVVKEELLARPAELGVRIVDGALTFDSLLLRTDELHDAPVTWTIIDIAGESVDIELQPGSLGLSVCQVPVVIERTSGEPWVEARLSDGRSIRAEGRSLGAELSAHLFGRTGRIRGVRAGLPI